MQPVQRIMVHTFIGFYDGIYMIYGEAGQKSMFELSVSVYNRKQDVLESLVA
jgi:hypothetical protein